MLYQMFSCRIYHINYDFSVFNQVFFFTIKEVKVCMGCGERYYDRGTMRMLEVVEEKNREEAIEI